MTRFEQLDYYQRLNVSPGASMEEIQRVYAELVRIYVAEGSSRQRSAGAEKSSRLFKLATEAYTTLSCRRKRARYDRMRRQMQFRSTTRSRQGSSTKGRRSGSSRSCRVTGSRRSASCFYALAIKLMASQAGSSSRAGRVGRRHRIRRRGLQSAGGTLTGTASVVPQLPRPS